MYDDNSTTNIYTQALAQENKTRQLITELTELSTLGHINKVADSCEQLQVLMEFGIPIDMLREGVGAAINGAIVGGHLEVVWILLQSNIGIDINGVYSKRPEMTLLQQALRKQHYPIVALLIQQGATTDELSEDEQERIQDYMQSCPESVLATFSASRSTTTSSASENSTASDSSVYHLAMELRAKFHQHLAELSKAVEQKDIELVRSLCKNLQSDIDEGFTREEIAPVIGGLFYQAVDSGNLAIVQCLIESDIGVNINERFAQHRHISALQLALNNEHHLVADYLASKGACVDYSKDSGEELTYSIQLSALAAVIDEPERVKFFLEHGQWRQNSEGLYQALHKAILNNQTESIKCLADKVDLNAPKMHLHYRLGGDVRPLRLAVSESNIDTIVELAKQGADLNTDFSHLTEIAKERGNTFFNEYKVKMLPLKKRAVVEYAKKEKKKKHDHTPPVAKITHQENTVSPEKRPVSGKTALTLFAGKLGACHTLLKDLFVDNAEIDVYVSFSSDGTVILESLFAQHPVVLSIDDYHCLKQYFDLQLNNYQPDESIIDEDMTYLRLHDALDDAQSEEHSQTDAVEASLQAMHDRLLRNHLGCQRLGEAPAALRVDNRVIALISSVAKITDLGQLQRDVIETIKTNPQKVPTELITIVLEKAPNKDKIMFAAACTACRCGNIRALMYISERDSRYIVGPGSSNNELVPIRHAFAAKNQRATQWLFRNGVRLNTLVLAAAKISDADEFLANNIDLNKISDKEALSLVMSAIRQNMAFCTNTLLQKSGVNKDIIDEAEYYAEHYKDLAIIDLVKNSKIPGLQSLYSLSIEMLGTADSLIRPLFGPHKRVEIFTKFINKSTAVKLMAYETEKFIVLSREDFEVLTRYFDSQLNKFSFVYVTGREDKHYITPTVAYNLKRQDNETESDFNKRKFNMINSKLGPNWRNDASDSLMKNGIEHRKSGDAFLIEVYNEALTLIEAVKSITDLSRPVFAQKAKEPAPRQSDEERSCTATSGGSWRHKRT